MASKKAANPRLWIRRAHLYCGLALLPWVLLYAVSGILFNHPGWSGSSQGTRFSLSELSTDAVVLDADRSAEAVVAALGEGVELESSPAPLLRRSLRARTPKGSETEHRLSVRFPSRRGFWGAREQHEARTPPSLGDLERLDVPGYDRAAWQAVAASVVAEVDAPSLPVELTDSPVLRFHARIDGESWQVDYDGSSGEVTFEPIADRDTPPGRVLARLHMTHVYPDTFGMGWIHALLVDLTALCLVLWCLTGVFMWWQMRKTRAVGAVVLVSGLAATVVILADVVPHLLS